MKEFLKHEEIVSEWETFKQTIKSNPTFRPVTTEAWKRCRDLGLEPNKIKFKFLSDYELKNKIKGNSQLINVAKPYMEHLSLSLTGIPHIVALSDKDGWIIDCSGTAEELGGKAAGLCIGASWSEKDIGNNGIGTALSTGRPTFVYGVEHFGTVYGSCGCIGVPIKNNGKIIGGLDVSVPIEYANPSRLYIIAACTNSIETSISNIVSNPFGISSELKASATTELIATAVHDLKNPLAVIRGLGQLGKITSSDAKILSYFDRVISQADEMNRMITDLLDIFKPEKLVPKKVTPIINGILEQFKILCKSKNIELRFDGNVSERVNICERIFKRTLENLITNAIQAMDESGIIEIKTLLEGKSVIISIKDNAGGISEELKDTLFEPFSFKRSGGTGLGLFMAYHAITSTHRGQIWFETETNQGTTFFIRLPIVEQDEKEDKLLSSF